MEGWFPLERGEQVCLQIAEAADHHTRLDDRSHGELPSGPEARLRHSDLTERKTSHRQALPNAGGDAGRKTEPASGEVSLDVLSYGSRNKRPFRSYPRLSASDNGRMTLFLRKPGVPLDNSLCERMLKRAILHRKNSLFYKTKNGARVGDLYMSLIATARLAEVDPFDYLIELQRHAQELAAHPSDWMPWGYRGTLARAREPGRDT